MDPRRTRPLLAALVAAALLALPAAAQAAWFPAEAIDGPSADILAFGGIDVAPDGTGGVVYLKNDGGVPHVFLSRLTGGVWGPVEKVDNGIAEPAAEPTITAGDGGQLVIAWTSLGRLYASAAGRGGGQPLGAPQFLASSARTPAVDLGLNDAAYVIYASGGGGGSDVRAGRFQNGAWTMIDPPLDIAPEQPAGDGAGRPRVAVSAEGYAVAVWAESGGGRRHVYGRRLTALVPSAHPQEISVPEFAGGAGGDADSPDIDIEEDGSFAWVAFRQDVGGVSRGLARRLVGSLFDPAVSIDDGAGALAPRVSINGRGVGLAASDAPDGRVIGSLLQFDVFGPVARWDSAGGTTRAQPVVAASQNEDAAVAWLRTPPDGPPVVLGRHHLQETTTLDPEALLSNPAFGPAVTDGRLEAASSRLGDFAVGFLQGTGADTRLVVAPFDRPPGSTYGLNTTKPRRVSRPELRWRLGGELWGPLSFKVFVDGVEIGSSVTDRFTPATPLANGKHQWWVLETDRRGQSTQMRPRVIWVDTKKPTIRVSVSGRRVRGNALRIRVRARDTGGSGVKRTLIDFGDRTLVSEKRDVRHAFRAGRARITVRAIDKAGNVGKRTVRVRIK
jgi:hypothetical protein